MILGKKFLITGGLGFIGSHIARSLIARGNECILVDMSHPSCSAAFETELLSNESISIVQGNILDSQFINTLSTDFDAIIHTAGILGIRKVSEYPVLTADVNVFGTRNILELALRQKKLERFLHFSTSEVYGIEAQNAKETDPAVIPNIGSRWIYASSKSFSEHLLKAYRTEFGLPGIIVRPFNVYGPHRKGSNAMTSFIERALAGDEITIHGTGKQVRSWCHIDDFVEGILQMLVRDEIFGEAFNLGNDLEPISILGLAQKICALCNSKSKISITNQAEDDVFNRSPNIEKAKALLSYCPKVSLDEGILSVVNQCQYSLTR